MSIARLQALFAERTGIDLTRGLKTPALERLITARSAELGLSSSDAYVSSLIGGNGAEFDRLVSVATVGLTWFFRDPEQLAAIGQLFREHHSQRPLEVWIAGCATGEDAYSVAMIAAAADAPVRILGTDINAEFLDIAARGEYGAWSRRNLPEDHSHQLVSIADDRFSIASQLRQQVRFARHNLMDRPPQPQSASAWDLIVCRNVLIYFYPGQAVAAVDRLAESLAPGGCLVLGPNEMTQFASGRLQLVSIAGRFVLERRDGADAAPVRQPMMIAPPPPVAAPAPIAFRGAERPARAVEPTDAKELLQRAHARHASGQLADALQLYAQKLTIDPLCAESRAFTGIVQYKLRDVAAAAVALRAALFLEPDMWLAAFYLALSYDALGKYAEASREYRRVVSCAGRPLSQTGELAAQLAGWKDDIVRLSLQRVSRTVPGLRRGSR
jgi:chemotaxis protein methyltransferase CheR